MTIKLLSHAAIALLMACALGCSRDHQSIPESHESHDAHAVNMDAPTLPAGQLWATDDALRVAMLRIRNDVASHATASEQRPLQANDAQTLALAVEENIHYMIANCKLEPKPDAALHGLIARMLAAAAALKKDPASPDAMPQLLAVLHDYQTTFDHPGWQPVVH